MSDDEKDFTVEIRVNVQARDKSQAIFRAREELTRGEGYLTAVFDENWDEV